MNTLYRMGISVSYDQVLEIENSLARAVCKRFEEEGLVCPANLCKASQYQRDLVGHYLNRPGNRQGLVKSF